MIRRPPRSTLDRSSAASDVYKRQGEAVGSFLAMDHQLQDILAQYGIYAVFALCTVEGDITLLVSGTMAHGGFFGDWGFFKAVSYTHLRAHETVLDIVCRLLLEKKNRKLKKKKQTKKRKKKYMKTT